MAPPTPTADDLSPVGDLTWTALLAHWVDFARAAVGLPDTDPGQAMRASIPDVVMLQALWFALDNMDQLTGSERHLGLDRAAVLFDQHRAALSQHWKDLAMPTKIVELIHDVRTRLQARDKDPLV